MVIYIKKKDYKISQEEKNTHTEYTPQSQSFKTLFNQNDDYPMPKYFCFRENSNK